MNTYADKRKENRSQSVANAVSQKLNGSESAFRFLDNRPEAVAQRKPQDLANHNTMQLMTDSGEKYNSELTEIINSLKALINKEDIQADSETCMEVASYIEKSTEVLKGDDAQAKEALIESARTGASSIVNTGQEKGSDLRVQMKVAGSAPVQRVVGIALGIGAVVAIGYGIYRFMRNHSQATPVTDTGEIRNIDTGEIRNIPTTREEFGEISAYGGLTTRKRTNKEIQKEVKAITDYNNNALYQQLIKDHHVTNIAQLIQNVRDDGGLCVGDLCHDLTRFLIQNKIGRRPRIEELHELEGATEIIYDLNSDDSLENLLKGKAPGTSVYLGSVNAWSGHTFTVVGENRGRVIVADRQPANPIAALKYASAVEAEAKLARNLNPDKQDDIDREFSGRLVLKQWTV